MYMDLVPTVAEFLEHPERVDVLPTLPRQCLFGPLV
jgi:hypothetical protein